MTLSVTKELDWEMAHRLYDEKSDAFYDKGKCGSLHGHTYKAQFKLELRPGGQRQAFGFIKDFSEFKKVQQWIDANFDHATLVSRGDIELLDFLRQQKNRFFEADGASSVEVIAQMLLVLARSLLNDAEVEVSSVTVWETPTSSCTVTT